MSCGSQASPAVHPSSVFSYWDFRFILLEGEQSVSAFLFSLFLPRSLGGTSITLHVFTYSAGQTYFTHIA
jgi:hypothetical protein